MLDHAATEDMLRRCGLAWTALRNGFYAQSGLLLMGDVLKSGVLEAPADGKVSWTAHADLAEAAAIILTDDGRFDGPTLPLTGSQSLDLADLTDIASDLTGKLVSRLIIADKEFRAKMTARNLPLSVVNISMGLYLASRQGEFAAVDPTLEQMLGRIPIRMRDLIEATMGG